MAAYKNTLPIPAGTWVLLTRNGPTTAARLQCQGPYDVHVAACQSAEIAPASTAGSLLFAPHEVVMGDVTLTSCFGADVVAGAAHLWGWCDGASSISVSHA